MFHEQVYEASLGVVENAFTKVVKEVKGKTLSTDNR